MATTLVFVFVGVVFSVTAAGAALRLVAGQEEGKDLGILGDAAGVARTVLVRGG